MTSRELRQKMREQKLQLRRAMAESKKRARAAMLANPAIQRERRKRLIRRLGVLTGLLLCLLFIRCDCAPPPAPVVESAPDAGADAGLAAVDVKPKVKIEQKQSKPPPMQGKVDPLPRGKYEGDSSPTPSWLDDYRLQVAARSPRLAECFKGSERPGAIRWSAAVNPENGAVSDHALEPVAIGASVEGAQRECVLEVLSSPPYKLELPKEEGDATKLPRRVSIVIEF